MPISQEDREALARYNAWRDDKMTLGSLEREILSALNRAVAAYDEMTKERDTLKLDLEMAYDRLRENDELAKREEASPPPGFEQSYFDLANGVPLPSPVRYSDGTISREYDEQPAREPQQAAGEVVDRIRQRFEGEMVNGPGIEARWHNDALEMAGNIVAEEISALAPAKPLSEERTADRIRGMGWSVAVHNDYRLNGEPHTFWLFTKDGRCVKGEGRTDAEALAIVEVEIDQHATISEKHPVQPKQAEPCS